MIKLSAIVLTKDEELTDTLESLSFCEEIIIIKDENSKFQASNYKQIQSTNVKVFKHNLADDFAGQRNYGLSKAKNEWVLFVDADERVSGALASEVSGILYLVYPRPELGSKAGISGYYIKRRDYIWGKEIKHGEAGNMKLIRLAKRNAGLWRRSVHEYWDIKGEVGELKNPLIHHPHQTLREFIEHLNYFSSLHAEENKKEGKASNIFKIILWPKLKFFYNYFIRLGFLDGTAGFVLVVMMSFHSFLAWSKQWLDG